MSRATELMDRTERDNAHARYGTFLVMDMADWQALRAEVERIEDELRGTKHVLSEIRNRQGKSQAVPRTMAEIEARALEQWEPLLEELWVATEGTHPESGQMWLTPRMMREANELDQRLWAEAEK